MCAYFSERVRIQVVVNIQIGNGAFNALLSVASTTSKAGCCGWLTSADERSKRTSPHTTTDWKPG